MKSANKTQSKSTVRNKKAEYRTGKNKVAENLIKRSFTPLLNKYGQARLTFCGLDHSISKNNNPYMKIIFSVLDITHDAPANIAILSSYRYSENNKLGRFLDILGYNAPVIYETIDDDDEFGVKATDAGVDGVFDFLRQKCGLVFKANLIKLESGLYQIDIGSLQPFIKDGVQISDYSPDEISYENFENPHIDIDDDG